MHQMGKIDLNLVADFLSGNLSSDDPKSFRSINSGRVEQADPRYNREAQLKTSIGHAVRDCRIHYDVKAVNLAKAAGISLAMLSQIEKGTVFPSLRTLQTLASVMGVPVTRFLSWYRETSRAVFMPTGTRNRSERLTSREDLVSSAITTETRLIYVRNKDDEMQKSDESGKFFIYCTDGELIYGCNDSNYIMSPGDSLFFEARGPHGIVEVTKFPTSLLSVRSCEFRQFNPRKRRCYSKTQHME